MGWSSSNKPKGMSVTEYFTRSGHLSWRDSPDSKYTYKVLDAALVRMSVHYAAVEMIHKETGERRVWCAVTLVKFYPKDPDWNFGYKGMSEDMGPVECDCPERILKLLTPPAANDHYAIEWRNRAWAKIKARKEMPKADIGSVVTLFGNDYQITEKLGRRGFRAYGLTKPGQYRISLSHVPKFTAVKPAASL